MPGHDAEPETIGDDEFLYRKIPVSMDDWYDASISPQPSPEAFRPHRERDTTGISFDRGRSADHPGFRTVEEAAIGKSPDGYYVAILRVGDLRARGIEVVPKLIEGNPGHAELPELKASNRKTDRSLEIKRLLADELTLRVEGPFGAVGPEATPT